MWVVARSSIIFVAYGLCVTWSKILTTYNFILIVCSMFGFSLVVKLQFLNLVFCLIFG
ncbi:hypothetical protein RchiOBHm_Chr1g0315401 [Rosa chinensis]|uniref:Uncharacterized protein n=1 Tax=Rosa chinensis TaxID=74649 RepID=A0A2P6S7C1_ROSCH|nr:hypothetical protein RchiOBHm_Chr1g0315401 [Rosa chinensis]